LGADAGQRPQGWRLKIQALLACHNANPDEWTAVAA
jgi:hypothetical protein